MTRVKICGNTNYENARLAVDLGADFLGFIFVPSSKRVVTAEKAEAILAKLPDFKNFVIGKNQVMPLPQLEVDNNTNLKQNDNY